MKNNILLIDIGNTSTDFLSLQERKERFKVNNTKTEEIENCLISLLSTKPEILISTVTSVGLKTVVSTLEKHCCSYRLLTPDVMKDYAQQYHYDVPNTEYLGSDLFCDIVALENAEGLIIIDLGTASKVIFLDQQKKFYGCLIAPGVQQCVKALNNSTDLLKEDHLVNQPPLVSLLTEECISSGAINGTAGMIVTMVRKIKETYSCPKAEVILTGGNAHYVNSLLKDFGLDDFREEPDLVLKGLARCFQIKIQ